MTAVEDGHGICEAEPIKASETCLGRTVYLRRSFCCPDTLKMNRAGKGSTMDWTKLINVTRLGCEESNKGDNRNSYHRDFDRIIFSREFRLLQAKTQVVPFPEHDAIHTRLTHSLETASVGRSLGTLTATRLELNKNYSIMEDDVGAIVSAACLCHDIGNPPLGHSGEDAISQYFRDEKGSRLIRENLTREQCFDFEHFEGNAIGFHLLTYSDQTKTNAKGGLGLTYSTLAAFVKYPNRLIERKKDTKESVSNKKPGLLYCDVDTFSDIANRLGLDCVEEGLWCRHPLAYLTEAADDICFAVVDLEDGYRNGDVTYKETKELFEHIIERDENTRKYLRTANIIDKDEQIGYLRAKAINALIYLCVGAFVENVKEILQGEFSLSLVDALPEEAQTAYKSLLTTAREKVYKRRDILLTEAAGFVVLPGLLNILVSAAFEDSKRSAKIRDCVLKDMICEDPNRSFEDRNYQTLLNIVQFVALMTDNYAVKLYRELTGIQLPNY